MPDGFTKLIPDSNKKPPSDESSSRSGLSTGTLRYAAPETISTRARQILSVEQLTARDVYSFGMLLFEMLHERRVFEECTAILALARSIEGDRPTIDLPPELADCAQLITECWDAEPTRRPRMEEVCVKLNLPRCSAVPGESSSTAV